MVHWLCKGLAARGHKVTLVASGDSACPVSIRSAFAQPPPGSFESHVPEVVHSLEAMDAAEELRPDVIHDHSLTASLGLGGQSPLVLTAHLSRDGDRGEAYRRLSGRARLVAISEAQRASMPEVRWGGVVHNAVEVSSFPFRADKEDFLVFLGRISRDKGAHLAVEAARRAGMRILLAGRIGLEDERRYWEQEVVPRAGSDLEYVGEADAAMKRDLLSRARALVFPICWDEPFGLVMAESLACGTPVVAFRRGAVPEIVDDGLTGFVVDDLDGLAAALGAIDRIDPMLCRKAAESRFDLPRMVEGYERIYLESSGRR